MSKHHIFILVKLCGEFWFKSVFKQENGSLSGSTMKKKKKKETYENFIYSFKKCFTWNVIQNSFIHKKNVFLWKSVSLFWIDFTSVLSVLQKSKVANNLITILGYSNDQNISIAKNIILID